MKIAARLIAGAIVIWSVQDILIWHTFFEGRPWSPSADLYQFWHQAFLVLLIVAGALWLRGRWFLFFAGATWTLANSGLADILYYWLARQPLPDKLPWLDLTHPLIIHPATNATVIASSLIWMAIWMVAGIGLTAIERRQAR